MTPWIEDVISGYNCNDEIVTTGDDFVLKKNPLVCV